MADVGRIREFARIQRHRFAVMRHSGGRTVGTRVRRKEVIEAAVFLDHYHDVSDGRRLPGRGRGRLARQRR